MIHIGDNVLRLTGIKMGIETHKFHASATSRKKVNCILPLDDDNGNKITNEQGLHEVARQYFVDIFQKQGGDVSSVIDVINPSIYALANEKLTAPFTKAEFRVALFAMEPDKCSGQDGYSPGFFINIFGIYVVMVS